MATLIIDVDADQAIRILEKLDRKMDQTGDRAEKSFLKAGAAMGLVQVGVDRLISVFVELAKAALRTFIEITEGAIALNKEAELTRLSLIQIFEGNEGAADAFIDRIKDLSIRLGVSRQELTGLAKGILPDVGSIEGTTALLEQIIVLGRDAGQGIDSIRIAAEEALSGNLSSLQRRLNIADKTIDSIKEYRKEMSNAEAITKALSERVETTGISAETTANSFATLEGAIRGQLETLQQELGVSPFEELKEQAQALLAVFENQGEGIVRVAQALGDVAANAIDFIGSGITDFIASLDFDNLEQLVVSFNKALAAGELLIDVLFDLPDTDDAILELAVSLEVLREGLESASRKGAELRLALQSAFLVAKAIFQIRSGNAFGAFESIQKVGEVLSDENLAKVAASNEGAFARYEKRIRSITEAQEERRRTVEDSTEADIAAGAASLQRKKQLEELEQLELKAGEAQVKIDKERADDRLAAEEAFNKAVLKLGRDRLSDQIKNAQKREDIERGNQEKIADIFTKDRQRREDFIEDLAEDEQKIARENAQDRADLERDNAQQRIDIERDFQRELRRIEDQFSQDAQDAERNNDAQAFLEAVRNKDRQVELAKTQRDENVQTAAEEAAQSRAELEVEINRRTEEVKIANRERLEDFDKTLQRELEAQALANERALETQAIQEQRQQEARQLAFEQELADNVTQNEKKLAQTEEALQKELEVVQKFEKAKADFAIAEAQRAQEAITSLVEEATDQRSAMEREQAENRRTELDVRRSSGLGSLAAGGDIGAGQSAVVGEHGPEIFTAPVSGTVIPNQTMFSPPSSPLMAGGSVDNSRSLSVGNIGVNPGDSILSRMVQNEVMRLMEALG